MLKEDFLKDVGSWNNHLVLLWDALQISHDNPMPVAEFGAGDGSTPYLRKFCADTGRSFISYEGNKEWAEKMGSIYVPDWRTADIYKEYSVVLIDHAPGEHRHEAVAILKDLAKIIVVHDSEVGGSGNYFYDKVFYLFKYRKDYNLTGGGAGATMLSNYYDVGGYVQDSRPPCKDGHAVNGMIPSRFEDGFNEKVCDCGRIKFYQEECSCPGSPGWQNKTKENI